MNVLYVDNHLLVVHKPAGQLSQGDATGDPSILDEARHWLKREYAKPGNVYVGLVHRLDRPVCGVMVLARTSKAASRLSDQFRRRLVRKTYQAVVIGQPVRPEGTLVDTLDDKECELRYRLLGTGQGLSLLEVEPLTGRKHQIRRQLARMGCPVLGDLRYGAKCPLPNKAIALRAVRLEFEHPTKREPLCFQADEPDWWPWPIE